MSGASDLVEALDEWSQGPVGQALGALRSHLRARLPLLLGLGLLAFVLAFPLTSDLIAYLIDASRLPDGVRIIVTTPVEYLLLQVRLAADVAVAVMVVVLLLDLLRAGSTNALPALGEHLAEVRTRVSLWRMGAGLLCGLFLAAAGAAYAAYGLVPLLLEYLTTDAQGVGLSTDWRLIAYVGFLVRLHVASVLGFQAPLVTLLILRTGIIEREVLISQRRQVWFGCAVAGAFVSPPDPLSLFLVAVPIVLLFEVGLLADRLLRRTA